MTEEQKQKFQPESKWAGRSLENYISMHPKARGAHTLTQARKMAFGEKHKNNSCKCKQNNCKRSGGQKASAC